MNIHERTSEFRMDWLTAMMVSLVLMVQGGAILAAPQVRKLAMVSPTQSTNISLGFGIIAIIVVESLVIIALWRLWKRLSDLTQKVLLSALVCMLAVTTLYIYHMLGKLLELGMILGACAGYIALDKILERFDMDWLTFNGLALAFGIVATAMLANQLAPIVVIPVLVVAIGWDHLAVNLSDIMGDLIEISSSAGIPNYLILPARLRINYSAVKDYVQDSDSNSKPSGVAGIIGVGDFVLPGLLATSAWVAGATMAALATTAGTVAAMAILRDAMHRAETGLPALPWLNTGALAGFAVGVILAGVPIATSLGL